MKTLINKEIKSYLSHHLVFILAAAFSVLSGITFLNLLGQYFHVLELGKADQIDPVMFVVMGFFNNINFVLIFLVPLICMGLFAKEYQQGTITLLLTSRFTRWNIIGAKFFSAFIPVLLVLSPLVVYLMIFWFSGLYEKTYLFSGVIGILFNLMIYISIGVFLSNVFYKSPMIAAFLHVATLVLLNSLQSFAQFADNYIIHKIILYISVVPHYLNLARGVINTSDLGYYFLVCGFFLFLNHKIFRMREVA